MYLDKTYIIYVNVFVNSKILLLNEFNLQNTLVIVDFVDKNAQMISTCIPNIWGP